MKLNNKGFAISGILYSLLILFLSLFIGLLGILASTKFSYDKVKNDIIHKLGNLPYKDDILNGADPILKEGMIPVTISNDGKVFKANLKDKWYDYDTKIWANAVMVENTNREAYLNAPSGTEINENDILAYFVWIPRYKYKLWYVEATDGAGTEIDVSKVHSIDIVFENKSSVKSAGTKNGEYLTHPAFTFGEEELDGIWVGKFETGYNGAENTTDAEVSIGDAAKLIVKPNVYSWRNINVSNMFATAKNMNIANNPFGLTTDSDTHMMKNTEWGAVAYLSHSNYGTCTSGACTEIHLNNNNSLKTGCGGNSASEINTSVCYNAYGTKINNIYSQSTTQNITGIFDMSGGSYEYVIGYTTAASVEFGSSGFTSTTFPIDSKYIDIYTSTSSKQYSNRILGDATGEMGPISSGMNSWYDDSANFISPTNPWFLRGGVHYYGQTSVGIFSFDRERGSSHIATSFRVVLV